jgi:hypothetical protein
MRDCGVPKNIAINGSLSVGRHEAPTPQTSNPDRLNDCIPANISPLRAVVASTTIISTTIDQDFFRSGFLSWELLYSETHGAVLATLAVLALISFKEVERYSRYTGPHGTRSIVFPSKMKVVNLRHGPSSLGRSTSRDSSVASETSSQDGSHHSEDDSSHFSSTGRSVSSSKQGDLPPPVLVYHESARSIVFRDHVRRACDVAEEQQASGHGTPLSTTRHASFITDATLPSKEGRFNGTLIEPRSLSERYVRDDSILSFDLTGLSNLFGAPDGFSGSMRSLSSVEIQGFQPHVVPLPQLKLGYKDEFEPLLEAPESQQERHWTEDEKHVVDLLLCQRAVVKTIKNNEWTSFLHRFKIPQPFRGKYPTNKSDIGPHGDHFPFTSFVTPCSLLPSGGKKMRCYGVPASYTTGVVFALPSFESDEAEVEAANRTGTWSWPSGYSAKTEVGLLRDAG